MEVSSENMVENLVTTGMLEPVEGVEGKFTLTPRALIFVEAVMKGYGISGLFMRFAELHTQGRIEEMGNITLSSTLH